MLALFSGGKDSLLAIVKAIEVTGGSLGGLVFTVPSFPFPSPHYENIECVSKVAEELGVGMSVVKLPRGAEQDVLASHLARWEASGLVVGDVLLDEHLLWHEQVAKKAGIDLVEPLYNRATSSLFREVIEMGIEFMIIACRKPCPNQLLGTIVNQWNANDIYETMVSSGVDPIGELGEYHTLVINAPFLRRPISPKPTRIEKRGPYGQYLVLDCNPTKADRFGEVPRPPA